MSEPYPDRETLPEPTAEEVAQIPAGAFGLKFDAIAVLERDVAQARDENRYTRIQLRDLELRVSRAVPNFPMETPEWCQPT